MTPQPRIGKISEQEMSEMAVESYRQIAGRRPTTPQQPDDEFRVTRWQLEQIAKYADLERIVWACLNKPTSRPAPSPEIQVISVEPHPPSAESLRCDNTCPCRTPTCEETCPLYQHDADVAAQARKDVLDIFDVFLNSDDRLTLYKWEVREKIRTLRTEGGEPR